MRRKCSTPSARKSSAPLLLSVPYLLCRRRWSAAEIQRNNQQGDSFWSLRTCSGIQCKRVGCEFHAFRFQQLILSGHLEEGCPATAGRNAKIHRFEGRRTQECPNYPFWGRSRSGQIDQPGSQELWCHADINKEAGGSCKYRAVFGQES